jgi:DNA-directed RNA polymerase specialized sigma24 family protein
VSNTKKPGSISTAILLLATGSGLAQELIFARYFARLTHAAGFRLRSSRPGGADAEMAALSALRTVFRDAESGKLPAGIRDREGLLQFLLRKTKEKAIQQIRKENRQKRGGGKVVSEMDVDPVADRGFDDWVVSRDPSAEEIENLQRLAAIVDVVEQNLPRRKRAFLELELAGWTTSEIMGKMGVSRATISAYRSDIRKKIQTGLDGPPTD